MKELKPLGKCPYTSTGLWWGITEKKHNILDHLPIGMSFSKNERGEFQNMFNSFRKEHEEDVNEMKKIMNEVKE